MPDECPRCLTPGCPTTLLLHSAIAALERPAPLSPAVASRDYLQLHALADIACSLRKLAKRFEPLPVDFGNW